MPDVDGLNSLRQAEEPADLFLPGLGDGGGLRLMVEALAIDGVGDTGVLMLFVSGAAFGGPQPRFVDVSTARVVSFVVGVVAPGLYAGYTEVGTLKWLPFFGQAETVWGVAISPATCGSTSGSAVGEISAVLLGTTLPLFDLPSD